MVDHRDVALELVDEGFVDARSMLVAALKYMSMQEVEDMLVVNEFVPEETV